MNRNFLRQLRADFLSKVAANRKQREHMGRAFDYAVLLGAERLEWLIRTLLTSAESNSIDHQVIGENQ